MQFQLPQNLSIQVAAYDSVLRPLVAREQRAAKQKKPSYTLGLPNDLLPTTLIAAENQEGFAKHLNGLVATERAIWNEERKFLLMHHQNVWMAVWLPAEGDNSYVYGISIAHKSAASTLKTVGIISMGLFKDETGRERIFDLADTDKMNLVKYGRTEFYRRSMLVTVTDIQNGLTAQPWRDVMNRWGKYHDKYEITARFTKSLVDRIPTWRDEHNIFSRLRHQTLPVAEVVGLGGYGVRTETGDLTAEQIIRSRSLKRPCWDTPFFRRELHRVAAECNQAFRDPSVDSKRQIRGPLSRLLKQVEWVEGIQEIYGEDVELDYLQRIYEAGQYVHFPYLGRRNALQWVKENVPIKSFIGWVEKMVEDHKVEWGKNPDQASRLSNSNDWGAPTFSPTELNDTLGMLQQIYEHQRDQLTSYHEKAEHKLQLDTPKRFRLTEFHDHVQAEAFKCINKNEALPQLLFPEPVKVQHLENTWTFFQPRDVHQLANWGQAVRNCVGNASSYREGIKKKTHFIILAMIDGKPQFTIQATVKNRLMDIVQIAGIGNRRLVTAERDMYELAFARALQQADEAIQPDV